MGDSDIMVIEKQKVREERIKRNQEKINMIRGVYEKG